MRWQERKVGSTLVFFYKSILWQDLLISDFYLEDVTFVNGIQNTKLAIQTRYNSEDLLCEIEQISESRLKVTLLQPTYGVAPGQFGVLYTGTKLIGGGRITSKLVEKVTI